MGQGLVSKLERRSIKGVITTESDPEKAVELYLQDSLEVTQPNAHHHGHN
jgi:hypothetical protein